MTSTRRHGTSWSRVRVALFFAALIVPLAIMVTPPLRSWTGGRAIAVPDWSWRIGDVRRYPARFQEQFDAALPFRLNVAAFSRSVYLDWLGASPVADVLLGTDGWLYYAGPPNERLLDRHVLGRAPLSPAELDLWRQRLIERTQQFRRVGAMYVFVIAPNKESIYPEHLPAWVGKRVGPTRSDQLLAHLQSTPSVTAIDLRPSLIAAKSAEALYFKTDTHWNLRGAYVAYRELMRMLSPEFPGLEAKSWESFEPVPVERPWLDMAGMIGIVKRIPEADFEMGRSPCLEHHPLPIPIPEALQAKLTAPAYATRCDVPANVDAVVFHDSFGVALSPFLAESFRSTVNFSATGGRNDVAGYGIPEKLKANLVIEIMVERGLLADPPF